MKQLFAIFLAGWIFLLTPVCGWNVLELAQLSHAQNALKVKAHALDLELPNQLKAYTFSANGLPEGAECKLLVVGPTYTIMEHLLCQVDSEGTLLEGGTDQPVVCVPRGTGPGQCLQYFVVYEPGNRCGATMIVPHPIVATQDAGYGVQVSVLDKTAQVVAVEIAGFEPGEALTVNSQSVKEELTCNFQANPDGTLVSIISADAKGHSGGDCRYSLKGTKGTIQLDFPWGSKYLLLSQQMANADFEAIPFTQYHR